MFLYLYLPLGREAEIESDVGPTAEIVTEVIINNSAARDRGIATAIAISSAVRRQGQPSHFVSHVHTQTSIILP
jgi:hypothetical protein